MYALSLSDYAILTYILHFFALCRGPNARTIFARHKIILSLNLGVKTKNKSSFQIGRQSSGPVACFSGIIFARGHDSRLGEGGSRQDSMVRISIHAHRFRNEEKKRSASRNLRLGQSVHPCFCPRTKVYLRLGGRGRQAVFFGVGARPEKPLMAPGHLTFFA